MNNYRHTYLETNLANLQFNYQQLRTLVGPDQFFCPMVKANAYGHGDIEVARELARFGCQWVGVGFVEEAVQLREAGLDLQVLVMGLFERDGAEAILDYDLTPVISEWRQLDAIADVAQARGRTAIPVHIKFNTGMNRLGFNVNEAARLSTRFSEDKILSVTGLCTHLYQADDVNREDGATKRQLHNFLEARAAFAPNLTCHVWNSAGLINSFLHSRWPSEFGARPGLALYGYLPPVSGSSPIQVKPVMSLKSQVITYHQLERGESVSYGGIWKASQRSLIGVVPVGYADGYPRALSNRGQMLFHGRRVPVIGHVCMDYAMIDLTQFHNERLTPGEEVVIFGQQQHEQIWLEEIAQVLQTIPYEVMTGIGERVPRKYVR